MISSPSARFEVALVVGVWKSSPTPADALFKWIKAKKGVEELERSRWKDFPGLYNSNWTRNAHSSHRAGRPQVVSRWHRAEKARLVSRWKRAERLCERSVSFSIFKVPSLLLRDATGGGWRSESCSWVAHQTLKLDKWFHRSSLCI